MCTLGTECTLRFVSVWGVCEFLFATDRPCLRLGEDLRQKAVKGGYTCLDAYSKLAKINLERRRLNYKLRPKWSLGVVSCCYFFFWGGGELHKKNKPQPQNDMSLPPSFPS